MKSVTWSDGNELEFSNILWHALDSESAEGQEGLVSKYSEDRIPNEIPDKFLSSPV